MIDERKRAERWSGISIAALMLLAFAVVLRTIFGVASGPKPPGPGAGAPRIETRTPQGAAISLSAFQGKVVLVDFWATWCPPCVAAMPGLERVRQEYRAKGFEVLGVNQEAGEEPAVERFLADQGISFPIAMDDGAIAHAWGVYTFPTSFLIGLDGRIRHTYRGPASEARLRQDIEGALLAGTSSAAGAAL